jgi:hypothetical protein
MWCATGQPLANPADLTAVGFPQPVRTDKAWFEGQSAAGKTTYQTYAYGAYGNVVDFFDANDQGPADDVEAVIAYYEDAANYIVGKASSIIVKGAGQTLRERRAVFQPGTGNLLEVDQRDAGGHHVDL